MKIKILIILVLFILLSISVFSVKEKIKLGEYKVKYKYKQELYDFKIYENIEKEFKRCLTEVTDKTSAVEWTNCMNLNGYVTPENNYLLFDVNTGKTVLVNGELREVVVKFAMKL